MHAGLVLLLAGEFISSMLQTDAQLVIEQGETRNYVERPRQLELAVVNITKRSEMDEVHGVPDTLLARGGSIKIPGTPVTLKLKSFFANADLSTRAPGDPASPASAGVGVSLAVRELPPVTSDDQVNVGAASSSRWLGGRATGPGLCRAAWARRRRLHARGAHLQPVRCDLSVSTCPTRSR